MIHSIIRFSVKQKFVIALLVLGLIGWGLSSLSRLPIDAVPDITNNQVQVVTISPSLAPREMEQYVTYPVELAMSNLPGVVHIRSVSRYGLSVVTLIFREDIPALDARQLVNEQIQAIASEIPEGFGKPEMMPITTGLGEIFQYTLDVKPGYEDRYDLSELRSIQDWIVKRYLSGIPGVVEISSFGGFLKQYEVSIDPRRLLSADVSINEIYDALAANNQNTGGSYIEQGNNALYIRSEGLIGTPEDIRQIVIRRAGGVPLRISDVAEVRYGYAPRFGALTRNGEGEAVGGITLMLKGANSNEVIGRVKERISQVEKTLPEGVVIKPYLDRSSLVQRTIKTVRNNLVEGGLIVVFVLVLLLGNLRAGLIVASVIPLSMLFALGMMQLTGVSANLMSLGAIDFGLIVDGAVIIVESTIFRLHSRFPGLWLNQDEMDESVISSSIEMLKSAAFGMIIILIVYLPILALEGVEGKMFGPMAQTVAYAILGALLLSLTYVPMASALFLSKKQQEHRTLADRLIEGIHHIYKPVLVFALRFRWLMLGLTLAVFLASLLVLSRMGGEFIPQLDEGDMAMQLSVPPGSSLSHSVRTCTRAEQILTSQFPEVTQVTSKIGTAEVPTDPMAVEDADIMISLKEKEAWTSAHSREELVAKMEKALEPLAKEGASFEFTQPIELRFNELLTGAKADVTVNMYGEDLQKLADLGEEASKMIRPIPGAADVKLDRTEGFPQIVASYRRDRLALYGLNVHDINQALNTAFAGGIAGTVFEGEKRFDLVLRFQEMNRKNIEDIRQLPVRLPGGGQTPLSELADIRYEEGPMLISRENTRRKITIGINVRNRDVESLVKEIQETLDRKLKLPAGYSLSYGGEFENLQSARTRLSVAVPIALFLIFALLFLTFNNMRQVLMIFSAIPLAAIGGIFALLLRGMPFSISAAIGFIALFGVAVLNGIVLIAFFNQLKEAGFSDVRERILEGTRIRLRPVLMTASVASLGFLPMAISGSAGAEVQRPLATVVIGGLISATFLTLIMLPVMYSLFGEKKVKTPPETPPSPPAAPVIATLLLLMLCMPLARSQTLSLRAAEEKALAENPGIQALRTNVRAAQVQVKTAIQLPMTSIEWQQGQINSLTRDQLWTLRQDLGQPLAWGAARSVKEAEVTLAEAQLRKAEHLLLSTVRSHYTDWLLPHAKIMLLREMDSLYQRFGTAARTRYESGEGSKLEWLSARQQMAALSMEIRRFEAEETSALGYLRQILGDSMLPAYEAPDMQDIDKQGDSLNLAGHPLLAEYESQWQKQQAEARLQQRLISPGLSVGYFTQSLEKVSGFNGVLVGVSLPLWFVPRRAEVLSARLRTEESLSLWEYEQQRMKQEYLLRQAQVAESRGRYAYYREQALPQADEIARIAQAAYQAGELDYLGLLIHLNETLRIRLAALDAWHDHQKALFRLQELSY